IDQPFIEKRIDEDFQAKIMGSNAARLVKGIPIKDIPLEDEYSRNSIPDQKRANTNKTTNTVKNTAKNKTSEKTKAIESNEAFNQAKEENINAEEVEKITQLVIEALKNT
ncbi:MAG: hypothetical protein D5S01_05880, partial [Halanaerobium sp. MSAO_Bac5]